MYQQQRNQSAINILKDKENKTTVKPIEIISKYIKLIKSEILL